MNIKKTLIALCAAAALATGANAEWISQQHQTYLQAEAGAAKIDNAHTGVYGIGLGGESVYLKHLFLGAGFNLDYASAYSTSYYTFHGDMRIGGTMPLEGRPLNVYAIVSPAIQSTKSWNAYGFGFGGGVEYRFSRSFSAAVEYKSYAMDGDGGLLHYRYSTTMANIRWYWKN
jgi:opacity protein-like surface antigen